MTHREIKELHLRIAQYVKDHPELTLTAIGEEFGLSLPMVSKIACDHGIRRAAKRGKPYDSATLLKRMRAMSASEGK
jgi:hypothetical protein